MGYKDELIDDYGYRAEIFSKSYDMMGRLLDRASVKAEVLKRQMSDVYIYGGGYLGIQLYNALAPFVNVMAVVDKSGRSKIKIEGMPVIDIDTFRERYKDELVIITPIRYHREICCELQGSVPNDKIICIEEFGGR